ncbi:response regulator [Alteromonas sp. CYL-A6]|uniref:response regulator n=1 Tax=Alteromonas nitratireducens TaxID=3390813 RepID=UPI0034B8F70F
MIDSIPAPPSREELKILVIDNQSLVHEVVGSALNEMGIRKVFSALNAYHALRLCDDNKFDFILIAFNVSNDRDGFHLFEELKHLGHITEQTTVVFLSAETSAELVNCIVELQPHDFWVKPLDRHRIENRLNFLIEVKRQMHRLEHFVANREYAAAIYQAERKLKDKSLVDFHPRLKRIIGEALMHLRDFERAEMYYRDLLTSCDYAWVNIGLARALLRQDKLEEAETLIEDLLERRDTRFLTYDLLAQYYIEKEMYEEAYEQIKRASALAPRNIERNRRLWDLARLNHDKQGQLAAVQNMAKYAKNSIHDSPDLSLNVIRSMIDLATSSNDADVTKLVKRAEKEIEDLRARKGNEKQLTEQLDVIHARIKCLKADKKGAEAIMKSKRPDAGGLSMEDNLDKMKAFHELGMREHCLKILDTLRKQIAGDTFSSQVVDEYLKQESIERTEIQFTTKELKDMATTNYRENRVLPAYNNLQQAMVLSPMDKQIALSLLKVLVQLSKSETLNAQQLANANKAASLLVNSSLSPTQEERRDKYIQLLSLDVSAKNDEGEEKSFSLA